MSVVVVVHSLSPSVSVTKYNYDDQLGRFIVSFEAYLEDNEAVYIPVTVASGHRLKNRLKMSRSGLKLVKF